MRILEQIGMIKGWTYEAIVSTYYENSPHAAPIGVWTDDFDTLHMEIYKNAKTLGNILKSREFAVNLVSDLTIFYESLFDKAKIAWEKSTKVNAPIIKDTPLVMEFRLKRIKEKENTFHLESTPVHFQSKGTVNLINRARALTLECLVIATKSQHLGELKIKETLKENYRVIKKVAPGSQYERILEMLFERMQISDE